MNRDLSFFSLSHSADADGAKRRDKVDLAVVFVFGMLSILGILL